jgi:hypothetical protein
MKHKHLFLLLMLLGLALVAAPALASGVALSQDLALSITAPDFTMGNAGSYTVSSAYAYALAGTSEVGPYYNGGDTVAAPGTATSTIAADSYVGDTTGSALFVGKDMHANMSGTSPGPFGSLSQNVFNEIFITLTSTVTGSATVTITPTEQSLTYAVTGQNGLPYFYYLNGYSNLLTSIYSTHNQAIDANYQDMLALEKNVPFGDFNSIGTPMSSFSFNLADLVIGETVTLDIQMTTGYDGLSQVPLPPAVWLFGSGLAGLLVARRRLMG